MNENNRKPLVGWERSAEANTNGVYTVFNAGGMAHTSATAEQIGIPAPPPPRTGRLGFDEDETRTLAKRPLDGRTGLEPRGHDVVVQWCRADVARWDAEDKATAEPETLTVTLPVEVVRWACTETQVWYYDEGKAIGAACRTALDEAGIP